MKKLRITAIALCLSIALCAVSPCALAEDEGAPRLSSAQSALIGDLASGRILYNVDAYSRRYPASLTKIMTLLLAVEAVEAGTAALDDMGPPPSARPDSATTARPLTSTGARR